MLNRDDILDEYTSSSLPIKLQTVRSMIGIYERIDFAKR